MVAMLSFHASQSTPNFFAKYATRKTMAAAATGSALIARSIFLKKESMEDIQIKIDVIRKKMESLPLDSKEKKDCFRQMFDLEIQRLLLNTTPARSADPLLNKAYLCIKDRMGIKEEIELRIMRKEDVVYLLKEHDCVVGWHAGKVVCVGCKSERYNPSHMIRALIHELEHHCQYAGASGSYGIKGGMSRLQEEFGLPESEKCRAECGADAAAAGMINCHLCLRDIAQRTSSSVQGEVIDEKGDNAELRDYFTSSDGYFTSEDFEFYASAAEQDGELCEAHRKQREGYSGFLSIESYLKPTFK